LDHRATAAAERDIGVDASVSEVKMSASNILSRQGRRPLQIGICLILFSSFAGFAIPHLASPRVGLSVHTLSGFQGVFLLAQGLLWPRLKLGSTASRVAFWCSIYGALAILAAYAVAAVTGVGRETLALVGELPHGLSYGSALQELLIKVLAYSSAPTGLTSFLLILWGLRGPEPVSTER
jgi:(hydroxyamino)benzene mutase